MLHVPNLSNNLLSIHKITQYLNCAVTFFPPHCVFQDLATGKTIGLAKEQGGLYYLQQEETKKCAKLQAHTSSLQQGTESWSSSQIWLQHRRLGHPPLSNLKSLFPVLFTKLSVGSLFTVMFVSLLNTIEQLFLRIIIEVQNLLILFILM